MANSILQEHNFNNLTVNGNLNLFVDADLKNKKMDTITATGYTGAGKIYVKAINILSDAPDTTTGILFTSSTVLKDKITSIDKVSSKLYEYDILYSTDEVAGYFNFTNAGRIVPKTNPVIFETAVASSVGGFATQSMLANQAFMSMDRPKNEIKRRRNQSSNSQNLYASTAEQIFESSNKIERGLWIRPYTTRETVNLNNMNVDNTIYGTLAGIDLAVSDSKMVSFYLGYAGSDQKYEDIKINQTGYILGATGMIIKGDYYLGLTANVGFNKAESESDFGTDKFDMNMYGIGAKAGYDLDLGKNWELEPNLLLMYGLIGNNGYKTSQGAKIDGKRVNNIVMEPQVKAKLGLRDGWEPYALLGYSINLGNKLEVVADDIGFKIDKINGYMEYGLGINKEFIDTPWNCYLQATGRSGGRKGISGNLGVKYSF